MKMPWALRFATATAILSLFGRVPAAFLSLLALSSPANVGRPDLMGALLLNGAASAIAVLTLVAAFGTPRARYVTLLLYPVAGILIYPIQNILVSFGYYPTPERIPDNQLLGAALYELIRYAWFIAMFIWLRLSRRTRAYLARPLSAAVGA